MRGAFSESDFELDTKFATPEEYELAPKDMFVEPGDEVSLSLHAR